MSVDINVYEVPPADPKVDVLIHIDESVTEQELFNLYYLWGFNEISKYSKIYEALSKSIWSDRGRQERWTEYKWARKARKDGQPG